jgi:hypothetical protein
MQTTWRKQNSCISSALTGQTDHPHRSDRWARSPSTWELSGQTGALHRSDRCHLGNCKSSKIARNHLETF